MLVFAARLESRERAVSDVVREGEREDVVGCRLEWVVADSKGLRFTPS